MVQPRNAIAIRERRKAERPPPLNAGRGRKSVPSAMPAMKLERIQRGGPDRVAKRQTLGAARVFRKSANKTREEENAGQNRNAAGRRPTTPRLKPIIYHSSESRYCGLSQRRARTVDDHRRGGFIFLTPRRVFEANEFGWRPSSKSHGFLGIFGTMIPVLDYVEFHASDSTSPVMRVFTGVPVCSSAFSIMHPLI